MTTYEYLQDKQPMRKSKHDLINVLAEQLNRPRHEIQEEFEQLLQDGKVLAYQDGIYYRVSIAKEKKFDDNFDREYVLTKPTKQIEEIIEYIYMTCPNFQHFKHAEELANKFNITKRKLRDIVLTHNLGLYNYTKGLTFDKVIYGGNKGYAIVSNKMEQKELLHSIDVDFYHQIEKRKRIRKRLGLNGQMEMTFEKMQYRIINSLSDDI